VPEYSVEPDLIHEYMGHIPMFGVKEYADFNQAIGIASLGATDEEITKLGAIYWHTTEFAVLR
jgi:phenylalanine-4-hydroxylase